VNSRTAVNSPVARDAKPRLAFPDLGDRIRIRAATQATPARRVWLALVDTSATRALVAFFEKYVSAPEPFAFPLPSGEIVAARFDSELSVTQVALGVWKVAPLRIVEAVGE